MYMKRMLEIGKATNGYVVECRAPIKANKSKDRDNVISEYPGSSEKQFIAKDEAEVSALITKLMPLLEEEYSSEDEFDAAFEKAAK